jgi:hypothetical protein
MVSTSRGVPPAVFTTTASLEHHREIEVLPDDVRAGSRPRSRW